MKHTHAYPFIYLFSIFIVIIYSNTLQVPFILDDRSNIVERQNLHLSTLSIENITNTFFKETDQGKKIYRPISCFSLALNYYIGQFNVRGYHVLNLIIHLLAAFFLFKTLRLLLEIKNNCLSSDQIDQVAGLATILWAAHPIQTQAVTYIVQRMASLSAMFYIMGIWAYIELRVRMNQNMPRQVKYGVMSALFFLCAILSKENAALFPLGLLCVELFVFVGYERIKANPYKSFLFSFVIVLIPVLFFFHTTSLEKLFQAYSHRPHTLIQRLLTESRVLIFYLSQLFYPVPGRFSVSHSFVLSNSLFSPLSTFLSISGISFMLLFAFIKTKKYPLLGFSIVFYFIHHIPESTIIPLELVFEHRNYLPSFFLFLPVAFALVKLLSLYRKQNKILFYFIALFCTLLIFFFGFSSYMRNMDWQTHESLWKSAVSSSPDLIRPYSQLGWSHTNRKKMDTDKAKHYFMMGLEKNESYHIFEKALLWLEIGKVYKAVNNLPECKKALLKSLDMMQEKIKNKPDLKNKGGIKAYLAGVNYFLANIHYYLQETDQAMQYIDRSLDLMELPVYYNTKAKFFIQNKEYSKALNPLQLLMEKDYADWETYFLLGNTLTSMGYYSQGLWFYKRAYKNSIYYKSPKPDIHLYIADNLYLSGESISADGYLSKYINSQPLRRTMHFIKTYQGPYFEYLPLVNAEKIFSKLKEESLTVINGTN